MVNPKSGAINVWPAKFYKPELDSWMLHNFRAFFICCVQKHAPEVVSELAQSVRPHYRSFFNYLLNENWLTPPVPYDCFTDIHPALARHWIQGKAVEWGAGANPYLEKLRSALCAWSQRYQIHAGWVLRMALDGNLYWTWFQVPKEKWLVLPLTPESSHIIVHPSKRMFEYPEWSGQDVAGYGKVIRAQFDRHLEAYLSRVTERAQKMKRTEVVRFPERFEMLARYLCTNRTVEQIGVEFANSTDASTIFRGLQYASKKIGLPMKSVGRPSKILRNRPRK